ncbi:MAG TPA: hypothetical protein VJH92_05950 [Candidatus Nanoarchaeia archaeon]|nr:hypothetical protein [Candidatus Nanoarchaeia archaeon]
MKKDKKMNTKLILVSFLAVVLFLAAAANVMAVGGTGDLTSAVTVEVDGTYIGDSENIVSVVAGETIPVRVWFTSDFYDTDVRVELDLEGEKVEASAMTPSFDVEDGKRYRKSVSIEVPYELKDDLSDDLSLSIQIDGKDHKYTVDDITLRVQRPSYNPDVKSITVDKSIKAGETFPVDIVLKNIGYDNLDDVYVTVTIADLGVSQRAYFGDIIALECDDNAEYNTGGSDANDLPYGENTLDRRCNEDDEDTTVGRLFLEMPYGVKEGVYNLEVEVRNDDVTSKDTVQISVQNEFETTVFKSGNSIWIVNPTDSVVGYRVVPESPASVSESIVFVPAGASKEVQVTTNAEGDYDMNVNVFTTKGELVDSINFKGTAGTGSTEQTQTSPIVILTVVLAIVFIVLLVVLIVLIGKKPEKSGEFGESYY